MGQVHQVLDHQHGVAGDLQGLAAPIPVGVVHDAEIRNPALVGQRRIAGPHPDPVVFLGNRIAAHPSRRRDMRLARDMHAGAVGREAQAVIGAFDGIASNPAPRELGVAVAAAVLQRDRRAVRHPVQHHRLAEHKAAHRMQASDLVAPGSDVPAVPRKHYTAPSSSGRHALMGRPEPVGARHHDPAANSRPRVAAISHPPRHCATRPSAPAGEPVEPAVSDCGFGRAGILSGAPGSPVPLPNLEVGEQLRPCEGAVHRESLCCLA